MNFQILSMFYLVGLIQICRSVNVYVNMSSFYSFPNKVMKAEVTKIDSSEFLLILFDNGTISQFDSQLKYLSTIKSLDSKLIIDFTICTSNYYSSGNTPSIMALIYGGAQWKLISLQNSSIQFSFVNQTGISYVFGEAAYFNATMIIGLRVHIYYQDVLVKKAISYGISEDIFYKNFTGFIVRDMIRKVVQVRYQLKDYLMSVTTAHRITLFGVSNSSIAFQSDILSNIQIDELFPDKEIIAFVQFYKDAYYATNMLSGASAKMEFYTGIIILPRILKGIRPRYDQYGDRFFITASTIFKVNLNTSNTWNLISQAQNDLTFDPNPSVPIGFAVFSSSNTSFLYQSNSPIIYAYCQSILDNACNKNVTLPCSLKIENCGSCNGNFTVCNQCMANYTLENNSCVYILSSVCFAANCILCYTNNTCLACDNSHILDTVNSQCILQIFPQNTFGPNSTNSTNSTTVDSSATNNTKSTNQINSTVTNSPNKNLFNSSTNSANSSNEKSSINSTKNFTQIQQKTNIDTFQIFQFNSLNILQRYESYDLFIKKLIRVTTIVNSSPIFRMFLRFLSPLFGLFDDYWFYIYHKNYWKNLIFFPDILVFMYLINKERILPDYLRFTDQLTIQTFQNSDYFISYTNKNILLIDEQMTYTQNNFEELILQQFPILIAIFLFIKLITTFIRSYILKSENLVLKNIKKYQTEPKICVDSSEKTKADTKNILIRSFTQYFEDCISFRSIIMTFFGSNVIYVSFQLSSQLRLFFSFKSIDTVNLILAIFFGMIFIIAFLVLLTLAENLYPSIKTSTKDNIQLKKAKEKERIKIKYGDFNFLVFNGIKCSIYGFIHGYFINQNQLQYILLILVKFILLIIIVRQTKLFQHSALAVFAFAYYLFGIWIDVLCLLEKFSLISKNFPNIFQSIYRDYSSFNVIEFILLVGLVTSVFGGVIFQFGWDLKRFLCPQSREEKIILQFRIGKLLSVFHKVKPLIEAEEHFSETEESPISAISNYNRKNNNHKTQEELKFEFGGPKYCFRNKLILSEMGKNKDRVSFLQKYKGLKARKDQLELRLTNKKSHAKASNQGLSMIEQTIEGYYFSKQKYFLNIADSMKTNTFPSKLPTEYRYDTMDCQNDLQNKSNILKKPRKVSKNLQVKINILTDHQRNTDNNGQT